MSLLSRIMIRNAIAGGGARIITLLVGMIITPYLLVNLGTERFGIWALLTVVTGMVALGDCSFKTSMIKHLSASWAAKDVESYRAIASCGFFFCCCNGLLLGLLLWWNMESLLDLLKIPEVFRDEAQLTFIIGVGGQLITICMSIFPALCDARQRLDVTNMLGVVSLTAGTILTVAAIEGGYGLPGVASAQLTAICFFHISSVFCVKRLFGPIGFSAKLIDYPTLRTLLRFGFTLHFSTICGVINRQFDKFLLSRWAGLGWVASYELALKWVGSAGSLQPYVAATMLPAGSQLSATGDLQRLRSLYFAAYRYLFLVGIPPFFFLVAHAADIIEVWIGKPDPTAAALVIMLSVGYLANSLSNGMAYVCQGIGKPDIQAIQSVVQLVINIGLSITFFILIGPLGAALGTSIALFAGACIYAVLFHNHLKISTIQLLKKTAVIPGVASLIAAGISSYLMLNLNSPDRLSLFFNLVVACITFMGIFIVICLLSGIIRQDDFDKFMTVWRNIEDKSE